MYEIEFFEGLPIQHESFLIEKYDSFITTCRYIEVNYPDYAIHYFTVKVDGKLLELLVYGTKQKAAKCFNSLVSIDQDTISQFTKNVFDRHPLVNKIEIVASYKEYDLDKSFLSFKSDDQILKLPTSLEDYLMNLGSQTRKHIRQRKERFIKDYPNARFLTKCGPEIEESLIDKIILLNCNRMKLKGTVPGIDNNSKENVYKYSSFYGCVAYIEIDGEVVAGCISTVLNKEVYAHVIGHNNNYSKFNLGEMCFIYLIETSIEKGISSFHFLWGETEYKRRLLAKPRVLYFYFVFRSFSLDFMLCKFQVNFAKTKTIIEHSNSTKPLRDAIKANRIKNMKMN
ncbi:MAG: GNAT family N-acetyltransferase [Paludibacter sp.]|nr:GNAT family N-acetyltransferase [Paludibacter sp.]